MKCVGLPMDEGVILYPVFCTSVHYLAQNTKPTLKFISPVINREQLTILFFLL
jgi:hypothetical protein